MKWLEMQGPWCPALLEHLERHHRSYDALIFFTYLYAPTVLGLEIDPSRSILVPTAHDEPAIRLDIYKDMFRLPAAVAFNTEVEKNFLKIDVRHSRHRRGNRRLRGRPDARRGRRPARWRQPEAMPTATTTERSASTSSRS